MNSLDQIQQKIFTQDSLLPQLEKWKSQGDKIVFTNGCFDLLHLGHIDYLAKAADLGHRLVLGLNTDRSVRELKGSSRPITNEASRAGILASLFFIDAVVLFDEQTPVSLISAIKPDVLVKGADYTIEQIVGADIVMQNGGQVKTVAFLPGYSTTAIEQRIRSAR